jgi:hypothetical protein
MIYLSVHVPFAEDQFAFFTSTRLMKTVLAPEPNALMQAAWEHRRTAPRGINGD